MVPLRRRAFKRRGQRSPQSWLPFTVLLLVTAFNTKFAFSLEVTHFFLLLCRPAKIGSLLSLSFFLPPLPWLDFTLLWGTTKGKKGRGEVPTIDEFTRTNERLQETETERERKNERKERANKDDKSGQTVVVVVVNLSGRDLQKGRFKLPQQQQQFSSVLALTGSDLKSEFEAIVRLRPKHG